MTRIGRWFALGTAALLTLAACGQGQEQGEGQEQGKQGLVSRGDIRIVMVTHGPPADAFWSVAKNGADQAARDLGVKMEYRAPSSFDVVEIQQLMESAIASKPDGLAVTIADTDALAPVVKKATDEGIPVVVLNAGRDVWQDVGALSYVGQTEYEAGAEAGRRLAAAGVTNALCINHQQGVVTLDQRCDGFEEGLGGTVKQVAVDGENPTQAQRGIEAALRNNPDANGMLALGPSGANPAVAALEGAGGQVKFGTFDLSPEILQAVIDGKALFAIDQQQWLQGYLPVFQLTQYVQYGVTPVGETPTGPAFVTKENAEDVLQLSKDGIR
ncbi:MAG: substrate-binding domain-containing protein [Streptosporangiales bacterium]|nr:substrate-binding domain-containing protein [Streptosporangiales bacterium]